MPALIFFMQSGKEQIFHWIKSFLVEIDTRMHHIKFHPDHLRIILGKGVQTVLRFADLVTLTKVRTTVSDITVDVNSAHKCGRRKKKN